MLTSQSPTRLLQVLLLTLLFNGLIALSLTLLGGSLYNNFVFSQCIGLSIFVLHTVGNQSGFFNTPLRQIAHGTISIIAGAVFGTLTALLILNLDPVPVLGVGNQALMVPVVLGLFFGTIAVYVLYSRMRLAELRQQAQQEQLRRLASEKELSEARLKLIQAQIEPHFLFNTLANIASLIGQDDTRARDMLEDLNRYLRTALKRTRKGKTTLGEELELVEAYLSIIRVRMGERLHYRLDVPHELHRLAFPPLLLQPLVENAILHGLEPKVDGGMVVVTGSREDHRLRISVRDDGLGLRGDWHPGLGLDNVYQRVKTLFDKSGTLEITENPQGGVTSVLSIPLPNHTPDITH